MRLSAFALAAAIALALGGCNTVGGLQGLSSATPTPRPKTVLVTDFTAASDMVMIDRGYTARLERKIGTFPTFERKLRTIERINDEIVATVVATLREAGLPAQPGSAEGLTMSDDAVVVKGRLHAPGSEDKAKSDHLGFGTGRGGVVADMSLSRLSSFGSKQVFAFTTEGQGGKPPAGKEAAARNAAIATALADTKAAPEKLSADVEAQARRMGRAIGERIVAFAREQGWLTKPDDEDDEAKVAEKRAPKPKSTAPVT